jgi:hypothetical protein
VLQAQHVGEERAHFPGAKDEYFHDNCMLISFGFTAAKI